jgi:hypothetical protein
MTSSKVIRQTKRADRWKDCGAVEGAMIGDLLLFGRYRSSDRALFETKFQGLAPDYNDRTHVFRKSALNREAALLKCIK